MKTKLLILLTLLITLVQGTFGANINRDGGSIIDVWTELNRCATAGEAATGLGDTAQIENWALSPYINLKAGAIDNTTYDWNWGTGDKYTYQVTVNQSECSETLPDGSKGVWVLSGRIGDGSQYVYIHFKNPTPAKPTTPSGPANACAGTSGNSYSTPGASGATSYVWGMTSGAGTITGTTATASVNFTAGWTGTASITVKGHNAAGDGPISDAFSVTVGTSPASFTILGAKTPQVNTSETYMISSVESGVTYTWDGTTTGSTYSKSWATISWPQISVVASNSCGTRTVTKSDIAVKDTNQVVSKSIYQTDTAALRDSLRHGEYIAYDTTLVPISVNDTTWVPVSVNDTTLVPISINDTTWIPVSVNDTTFVPVLVNDTTLVPISVNDTTWVPVSVNDTTLVPVLVNDTTLVPISVNDTTWVPVSVNDTTFVPVLVNDTTLVPISVNDTTWIPVSVNDTTFVPINVYDTIPGGQVANDSIVRLNKKIGEINDLYLGEVKTVKALTDTISNIRRYALIDDTTVVTGILQLDITQLTMYPNPTTGPIHITSSETVTKIEVWDMTGKLVKTATPNAKEFDVIVSNDLEIDQHYLIRVTTSKGFTQKKFLRKK